MAMPNKRIVIEQIIEKLNTEIATVTQAARAAHEAATHEESKAEDQHDTRGLEASYLAGAQANRVTELAKLVSIFKLLPTREFGPKDPIALGALVELDLDGRRSMHLLAGLGGGVSVQVDGKAIHVITPQAPLGDALMGKKAGDIVEVETQGATREYEVVAVS